MVRVSVIVPVFGAESYLRRCLGSIVCQTFSDWEAILVDDGSVDGSGRICDEYAGLDSRFKVFHKENGGVSSAREAGLAAAAGEYVIHMDPDDWIEPGMLYDLFEEATRSGSDMVICDFIEEWEWGKMVQRQAPYNLDHESVLRELYSHLHGSCCNKLVRRSLFQEYDIHFPAGMNFCEDLYVNTALLKHDIKVSYLPKAFYHYDHTTNPSSIVNDRKRARQRVVSKAEGLRPLLEHEYPDLWEKIQFNAKRGFLDMGERYSSFLNLYPELNGEIARLEELYSKDKVMSFAMRGCFNYHIAHLLGRFKDFCFILRHFH